MSHKDDMAYSKSYTSCNLMNFNFYWPYGGQLPGVSGDGKNAGGKKMPRISINFQS
jgi:hypothetical protein